MPCWREGWGRHANALAALRETGQAGNRARAADCTASCLWPFSADAHRSRRARLARSASHVVILLVKKYPTYKIINYDKLDYCSSLKNLECVEDYPNYEFVHGDILAADLVNFVIRKENVDTIMHFAAQTHVGEPDWPFTMPWRGGLFRGARHPIPALPCPPPLAPARRQLVWQLAHLHA